jgi:O-methyltransferase
MIRKLLKIVTQPIHRRLQLPSFRYSGYFMVLQDTFTHLPHERVIKTAMDFVSYSNLEGDYLEFGVFQGSHFTTAFRFAQMNHLDFMKFYAFDSFQGLPEITGLDGAAPRQFSKGEFSCDAETFTKNISRHGVDLNKVVIIPGWFDQSLNLETKQKLPIKKAAIVWIDCDFYESTVPVLDFITDYIQDGTLLIFDDWFCFNGNPDYGEQRAFREWLGRNPSIRASEFHKYGWTGNSFILHRTV